MYDCVHVCPKEKEKKTEKRKNRTKVKATINKQNKTEATCSNRDTYEVRDSVKAKLYRRVSWRLLIFKKENISYAAETQVQQE